MKKIYLLGSIFAATMLLSGCSLIPGGSGTSTSGTSAANFFVSGDGGATWNPKVKVDEKKSITAADILTIAAHPTDSSIIYAGTMSNGLLKSTDGAETWQVESFAQKAYAISFDPQKPNIIYAAGVYNKRGKIFKKEGEGEWKEIYTEPAEGTFVASLAVDQSNSDYIYAGTSDGVIIKSTDAGKTWKNLEKADGPVTSIVFDAGGGPHLYFGIFQQGVLETLDGGNEIVDMTSKEGVISGISGKDVYSVVADPIVKNVLYVGTDKGVVKVTEGGKKWESLNVIASSEGFAIRGLAINPQNNKEIIYVAARAIYRTIDGGVKWSTYQLDTKKGVGVIKFSPADSQKVYMGLRNI